MDADTNRAPDELFDAAWREHGVYLRRVATRLLGDAATAEDTVQEAFARLAQTELDAIRDVRAWLAVVVRRLSIDRLRSAYVRRESAAAILPGDEMPDAGVALDPLDRVTLDDQVQLALAVVLDELSPPERTALVLHDVFAMPFDEIGRTVGRSPAAVRQLASRARRRVQGMVPVPGRDRARERVVVGAFLAASRDGDFDALLLLLDPDAVFSADADAERLGVPAETRGADRVADAFAGRAQGAQLALIDGDVGLAAMRGGTPRGVFTFRIVNDGIETISFVMDAERITELDIAPLDE